MCVCETIVTKQMGNPKKSTEGNEIYQQQKIARKIKKKRINVAMSAHTTTVTAQTLSEQQQSNNKQN